MIDVFEAMELTCNTQSQSCLAVESQRRSTPIGQLIRNEVEEALKERTTTFIKDLLLGPDDEPPDIGDLEFDDQESDDEDFEGEDNADDEEQ